MNSPIKIVIIHDGLTPKVDPLIICLEEEYGKEEVIHFENSDKGLDYVLGNLDQKMIVLLDKNFSQGEKSGIQVFEEIRKRTSLVYIILLTADEYSKIKAEDLVLLINHDAFAIENVTADYTKVLGLVSSASHKLNARVDAVLEEWITKHSERKREQPLLRTKEGKVYSMKDILDSIRLQTEVGKEFERNLIRLAIEIFSKQKLINND